MCTLSDPKSGDAISPEIATQKLKISALLKISCSDASTQFGRVYLIEARKAYRRAAQLLLIVVGPSHPYSESAIRELLAVQNRPPAEAITLGPELCNLCGGKGVPHGNELKHAIALRAREGKALSKCSRCRSVAYCCPEHQRHQRAQWRLHKAACVSPPSEEKH